MKRTPRAPHARTCFIVVTLGSALVAACARVSARTIAPVPPVPLREDYCWWAVLRSERSVDSVATRFTQAYIAAGFSAVAYKKQADTAWAIASPTGLGSPRAMFASRAVAYWHGDSTHFRYFVSVGRVPDDRTTEAIDMPKLLLGMCAQIARAAAIGWSAPRSPTGEEGLSVWKREP